MKLINSKVNKTYFIKEIYFDCEDQNIFCVNGLVKNNLIKLIRIIDNLFIVEINKARFAVTSQVAEKITVYEK